MAFRGLVIASVVYRTWGKMRLRHLGEWISDWIPDSAYAGGRGRGASDAWHYTAVGTEADLLRG
eukprot:8537206-Alexandrium_andersonii.AAC.1